MSYGRAHPPHVEGAVVVALRDPQEKVRLVAVEAARHQLVFLNHKVTAAGTVGRYGPGKLFLIEPADVGFEEKAGVPLAHGLPGAHRMLPGLIVDGTEKKCMPSFNSTRSPSPIFRSSPGPGTLRKRSRSGPIGGLWSARSSLPVTIGLGALMCCLSMMMSTVCWELMCRF